METKNKFINKNALAIFVCWLVYTCSYIGKLGYNANITQIESEFGITHAESGSVGTIFFFAYGAGQIINGIFCKKYNLKLKSQQKMRSNTSLLGRDLLGIASEMLEI